MGWDRLTHPESVRHQFLIVKKSEAETKAKRQAGWHGDKGSAYVCRHREDNCIYVHGARLRLVD
jgi:hypothetical protein